MNSDKMAEMIQKMMQKLAKMLMKLAKMIVKLVIKQLLLLLGPVGVGLLALVLIVFLVLAAMYGGSRMSNSSNPTLASTGSTSNTSGVTFTEQLSAADNQKIYNSYTAAAKKYEPHLASNADQAEIDQFTTPWYVLAAIDGVKNATRFGYNSDRTTSKNLYPTTELKTAPILQPTIRYTSYKRGSSITVETTTWTKKVAGTGSTTQPLFNLSSRAIAVLGGGKIIPPTGIPTQPTKPKKPKKPTPVIIKSDTSKTQNSVETVQEPTYIENWDGIHKFTWKQIKTTIPTMTQKTGQAGQDGSSIVKTSGTSYDIQLVKEQWTPNWSNLKKAMKAAGYDMSNQDTVNNYIKDIVTDAINYDGLTINPANFYEDLITGDTEQPVKFVKPFLDPIQNWPVSEKYNKVEGTVGPWLAPYSGAPQFNQGTIIVVPTGTPVHSMTDGTVSIVQDDQTGMDQGNEVQVTTKDGSVFSYGYLSKFAVKDGTKVQAGQLIGYTGTTGMGADLAKPGLYVQAMIGAVTYTNIGQSANNSTTNATSGSTGTNSTSNGKGSAKPSLPLVPRNLIAYVTDSPTSSIYSDNTSEFAADLSSGSLGGAPGASGMCGAYGAGWVATGNSSLGPTTTKGQIVPPAQKDHWTGAPPKAWIPMYQQASQTFGIPASILIALNQHESSFCPYAIAGNGSKAAEHYVTPLEYRYWPYLYEWATGLGQFEPSTWIGEWKQNQYLKPYTSMSTEIWNPQAQIIATAAYLKTLGANSNPASIEQALEAYNGDTHIDANGNLVKVDYARGIMSDANTYYAKYNN